MRAPDGMRSCVGPIRILQFHLRVFVHFCDQVCAVSLEGRRWMGWGLVRTVRKRVVVLVNPLDPRWASRVDPLVG